MSNTDLTFTAKNLLTAEFSLPFSLFSSPSKQFKHMRLIGSFSFVYLFYCGRRPVNASSVQANVSGSKFSRSSHPCPHRVAVGPSVHCLDATFDRLHYNSAGPYRCWTHLVVRRSRALRVAACARLRPDTTNFEVNSEITGCQLRAPWRIHPALHHHHQQQQQQQQQKAEGSGHDLGKVTAFCGRVVSLMID